MRGEDSPRAAREATVRAVVQRSNLSAALLALLCGCASNGPAPVPEGFELVYSQDFEGPGWCTDFGASDASAWGPGEVDGGGTALFRGLPERLDPPGAPLHFLWLGGPTVEDFVLEFEVLVPEGGAREIFVYFGIEAPERFVYASLAAHADERSHDVFRVDRAPPLPISRSRTFGVDLAPEVWHRVRVGRSSLSGRVVVGFGPGAATVLTAGHGALAAGWIGVGVRGGPAHFDRLRLWAPDWTMKSLDFLPAPGQSRR
jgi:hypothetical protein